MSVALLDVNVLLALAWSSHEHFEPAQAWRKGPNAKWATCTFTQVAFIRLSSNPNVVDPVATPQQAGALLQKMTTNPAHTFWVDDMDIKNTQDWPPSWVRGHKQVTDAHLLRLVRRHHGKLVTFDAALAAAAGKSTAILLQA